MSGDKPAARRTFDCAPSGIAEEFTAGNVCVRGRDMRKQDVTFDYDRYRRLLVEAVDETKRLALIQLLIEERAMDRLAAQRDQERAVVAANVVARLMGAPPR